MYGQQMNMFQEGGVMLEDEGGEVEEASGNEVPLGGTKEGVADDQPANLSPGEMVLSADVVNYHGVEKVMSWRDQAKIGYHKMEAMGQLGNADEATIPTEAIFNPGGMPFSVVDLEYIDMDDDADVAEAASGMYVQDELNMQTGGTVPSVMSTNPVTGQPQTKQWTPPPPGTSPNIRTLPVSMTPIPSTPTPVSTTPTVVTPSSPITQQPAIPTPSALPTTGEFLGGAQSFNQYINVDGNIIKIPVVNGRQTYPTPEGYQKYDPKKPKPFDPALEQKDEEVKPETTLTQEPVIPPHLGGIGADDAAPDNTGTGSGSGFLSVNPSINPVGVIGAIVSAVTGLPATAVTGSPISLSGRSLNEAGLDAFTREDGGYTGPTDFKNVNEAVVSLTNPKNYGVPVSGTGPNPYGTPEQRGTGKGPSGFAEGQAAAAAAAAAAQADIDVGAGAGIDVGMATPDIGETAATGIDVGREAGPGGFAEGQGAAAEAAADVAAGVTGPGGSWGIAEGGFVPKIKFKSNPKQRRKGLAARK
jgi:hypothetical protein